MSEIIIVSKQQRLIIDPPSRTVSIISTGPIGATGPPGASMVVANEAARLALTPITGVLVYVISTKRQWVHDGVNWLLVGGSLPKVLATRTTVQAAGVGGTILAFTSESYDTDVMHDTAVNNDRLTIPTGLGGLWRFAYSFYFESVGTAGRVVSYIQKNGGNALSLGHHGGTCNAADDGGRTGTAELVCVPGDYFNVYVFNATARNLGSVTVTSTFSGSYVGPT